MPVYSCHVYNFYNYGIPSVIVDQFLSYLDPRRHFLIPVMYRKCKVPDFIAYLFYLDYTRYKDNPRQCEEYFWERLYKSVRYQQR